MNRNWPRWLLTMAAVGGAGCQLAGPRPTPVAGPTGSIVSVGKRPLLGTPETTMRIVGGYREITQADGSIVQIPESAAQAIEVAAAAPKLAGEPKTPESSTGAAAPPAPEKSPAADTPKSLKSDPPGTVRRADTPSPERRPNEGTSQDPKVAKYVLKPGDRLEIVYLDDAADDQDYRLQPGDEIRVEYLHLGLGEVGAQGEGRSPASTLDRNVKLQPDGKVALPYIGLVAAAGRDPAAFADVLNERYRKFYVDPRMLVTLVNTGSGIRDLREGLRTAGSRLVEISPEGRINLPFVGFVNVADLTVAELQTELTERHRKIRPGTTVTVRLVRGSEK